MKRLRTILIFLLLGAVVNVAVAWGCAVLVDGSSTQLSEMGIARSEGVLLTVVRIDHYGSTVVITNRFRDHGGTYMVPEVEVADIRPYWFDIQDSTIDIINDEGHITEWQHAEGRGWPMISLMLEYNSIVRDNTIVSSSTRGMIVSGRTDTRWGNGGWNVSRNLPWLPVWTGIVLNTIFYATTLWLLLIGPFALRRHLRHRQGLCLKCAYDLRGVDHQACPECGTPTSHARQ